MIFIKRIFFISLLFISSCSSNKPIFLYVTANALNVRATPNINSKIICIIPFGTKIKVFKTKHKFSLNKIENYWFYYPKTKGFIFGKFLSKKRASINKFMSLICYDSGGLMQSCAFGRTTSKLILSNGKARYNSYSQISLSGKKIVSSVGLYTISSNCISISFKEGKKYIKTTSTTGIIEKNIKHNPFVLKLFYLNKLKGFVKQSNLKLLSNNKFSINIKKHHFISKESKANLKKGSGIFRKIGYFF